MKNRKKIALILFVMLVGMIWNVCLATDENITDDLDLQNISGDDGEYINSYEDYENLANDTNTGYSQDELKEYYNSYQDYMKGYYREYQRADSIKARVIEVDEIQEEYEFNDYYYSVSKYKIQPIKVKILEGDHAGEEYAISYLLTGDSLSNIEYAALKKGDVIFVGVSESENGEEVYADITNTGANVERLGVVICIGVVALLLLIIYGGKKGVLSALILLLALDFCLVIVPNMGFDGQGFILGGVAFIVLLIATMVIAKMGFNKKSLVAGVISAVLTLVAWMLIVVADYLTRTVGVTFEVAAIAENVVLGNMNFEHLYIIITLMIAAVTITNVVCQLMKKLEEKNAESVNEKLEVGKEVLNGNILMTVITLLVMYIPNHLLLLTNKYTSREIWNAEILVSELIRIFVVIIVTALAIPTTAFATIKEKE